MKSSIAKKRQQHKLKCYAKKFVWLLRPVKLLIPLIVIGFITSVVSTETSLFEVKKVAVIGTKQFVNKKDFYEIATTNLMGKRITAIDNNSVANDLLNQFQGAKSIQVVKKYPGSIVITVKERTPLAVIGNAKKHYLVDEEGYVLGAVDATSTNLPEVNYDSEVKVGYFIDENLIPVYLELISSIDKTELKASSISANDKQVTFYLNDKIQVLINTKKQISTTISVLADLYTQLVTEGKEARRIDLRYDKVIVSYEE